MILAGHQPEYLPYIGYFYKMQKCDQFILVDHVQYEKKNFQNRNKIRTAQGFTWLTVPVETHGKQFQKINEVEIKRGLNWREKHYKAIYLNYKNTPHFEKYADFLKKTYEEDFSLLVDLNEKIIRFLAKEIGIKKKILKSSEFNFKKKKEELLIEMCKTLGADTYLSGKGGQDYVEDSVFKKQGLKHVFSDFKHPEYKQRFKPFLPYMSTIDLLFNCGPKTLNIIKSSFEEEK